MTSIALRPYQAVAVDEVRAAFGRNMRAVLFVLPTGGGKTYTFSYIADAAATRGRRVVIIVHRKELLLQASKSLQDLGIEHGLISPWFTPNKHAKIQVASIDTLLLRLKRGDKIPCDMAIYDEAHHAVADNKWDRVQQALGNPPMLGVTATPVRTDGKGLGVEFGGLFHAMVLGPSVSWLIEQGMLLNPIVYTSIEQPDFSGVAKTASGDLNMRQLAERTNKPKITGEAVEHYQKVCPGARCIVFCTGVAHARQVVEQFNAAGYRFALLVGEPEMSDAERSAVNRKLRRGELDGAVTVDLVSEGYDLPDLSCCIMLRRTESEGLFLQQVGRVMRPAPGKTECWLLDQVGNVGHLIDGPSGEFKAKHGFPNWDRDWGLEGRKKKKRGVAAQDEELPVSPMKQCGNCFVVHAAAPVCPRCGHVYPLAHRKIEVVEGALHLVSDAVQQAAQQQRRLQGKAQTVEEMVRNLGYSRARAEMVVKARQAKQSLAASLIEDMQAWALATQQIPREVFQVGYGQIKQMKPKELAELRRRFDAHRGAGAPHASDFALQLTPNPQRGHAA